MFVTCPVKYDLVLDARNIANTILTWSPGTESWYSYATFNTDLLDKYFVATQHQSKTYKFSKITASAYESDTHSTWHADSIDQDIARIIIPINTDADRYYLQMDNSDAISMEVGKCYAMNVRLPHRVYANNPSKDFIALVVDFRK